MRIFNLSSGATAVRLLHAGRAAAGRRQAAEAAARQGEGCRCWLVPALLGLQYHTPSPADDRSRPPSASDTHTAPATPPAHSDFVICAQVRLRFSCLTAAAAMLAAATCCCSSVHSTLPATCMRRWGQACRATRGRNPSPPRSEGCMLTGMRGWQVHHGVEPSAAEGGLRATAGWRRRPSATGQQLQVSKGGRCTAPIEAMGTVDEGTQPPQHGAAAVVRSSLHRASVSISRCPTTSCILCSSSGGAQRPPAGRLTRQLSLLCSP
jgi:hypothetical protein